MVTLKGSLGGCGGGLTSPIECPTLEKICAVSTWNDIDLSMVNSLRDTASVVFTKKYGFRMSTIPFKLLSEPIPVLTVDFAKTKMGFASDTQKFKVKAGSVQIVKHARTKHFNPIPGPAPFPYQLVDAAINLPRDLLLCVIHHQLWYSLEG